MASDSINRHQTRVYNLIIGPLEMQREIWKVFPRFCFDVVHASWWAIEGSLTERGSVPSWRQPIRGRNLIESYSYRCDLWQTSRPFGLGSSSFLARQNPSFGRLDIRRLGRWRCKRTQSVFVAQGRSAAAAAALTPDDMWENQQNTKGTRRRRRWWHTEKTTVKNFR